MLPHLLEKHAAAPRDRLLWAVLVALAWDSWWRSGCCAATRCARPRCATSAWQVQRVAVADCLQYIPRATLNSCADRVDPDRRDGNAVMATGGKQAAAAEAHARVDEQRRAGQRLLPLIPFSTHRFRPNACGLSGPASDSDRACAPTGAARRSAYYEIKDQREYRTMNNAVASSGFPWSDPTLTSLDASDEFERMPDIDALLPHPAAGGFQPADGGPRPLHQHGDDAGRPRIRDVATGPRPHAGRPRTARRRGQAVRLFRRRARAGAGRAARLTAAAAPTRSPDTPRLPPGSAPAARPAIRRHRAGTRASPAPAAARCGRTRCRPPAGPGAAA